MGNPAIWIPVKVLVGEKMRPGKEELEYFVDKWKSHMRGAPFTGEYNLPATNDTRRLMTIRPSEVSHCITDIKMETYDPKKATVMMQIRFSGPKGEDAADDCMANKLRFVARSVKVTEDGEPKDRIVTFDCIHAPKGVKSKKSLIV